MNPENGHGWASLDAGPLVIVLCRLGSTHDLCNCALVCKGWHAALHSPAPWAVALKREFGHVTQSPAEHACARQLLAAARTSRLYLVGNNFLGPACSKNSRFTAPEQLMLTTAAPFSPAGDTKIPAGNDGGGSADNSSTLLACLHTVSAVPAVPSGRGVSTSISVRTVAAGADFAVLLTWHGWVLDSRCLPPTSAAAAAAGVAGAGGARQQGRGHGQQQGTLDWGGLWQPPCCRATQVAAGGCWQGSGRPGGHVLVLTDRHTVWGWGGNLSGQLGAGFPTQPTLGSAAPAGTASAAAPPTWVGSPLEVVDSAAAACLGLPQSIACGDQHSMLLTSNSQLFAAGSNAAGACGLPVVQLQAGAYSEVPLPAGQLAASVSCGGGNSAVVTRSGRLLVCGGNEYGQAGVGKQGGSCFMLADIGPSVGWHGMQRANQQLGGGGGDAAAAVSQVACGSGSLYSLTDRGEAFSWGQGGQGELALGGSCKNTCTPSRMPWAHDATFLAASCGGGRFGALLDTHGRLFTFGAGKSGALGHGDTAKRAVGRQVKALAGHSVHSAACGSDWMMVVAGWKAPVGRGGKGSKAGKAGMPWVAAAAPGPADPSRQAATQQQEASLQLQKQPSFRYLEVDPAPPPRSPRTPRTPRAYGPLDKQPSELSTSSTSSSIGGLAAGSTPSTPRSRGNGGSNHRNGGSTGGAEEAGSTGGRLRGRSGREQRREDEGRHRGPRGGGSGRGGSLLNLPDAAPEAARARRQRWMAEPPVAASTFSEPSSDDGDDEDEGEEGDGGEGSGSRSPRWVDREMAYLLRRQLKAFSNDPRQRQIIFPRDLSGRDRWKVHVMAEGWGLMHESYGEGARRKIVVWKPSRSRKSLKPDMLAADSVSDSGGDDGGGKGGAGGSGAGGGGRQGEGGSAGCGQVEEKVEEMA